MQYWHDIGQLKSYSLDEFDPHAELILRSEGLQGNFANLSICEPVRGDWGDTRRDLPRHFIEYLSAQLEPQSGYMLGSDPDELLKPYQTEGYPEIAQAMKNKKVKFLIGTQPNGHRMVRVLMLTGALHQGASGQKKALSTKESRNTEIHVAQDVDRVQGQKKDFSMDENTNADICEKCRSNPGKPFIFHYGQKLHKDTIGGPELYKESGQEYLLLCERCITILRDPDWNPIIAVGIWIIICGIGYQIFQPGLPQWVGILAFLFVVSCILQALKVLLKSTRARGEDIAIALRTASLMQQGFDTFWNTGEYKRLKAAKRIR